MVEWFSKQPPEIIVTIISSISTIVIVVLTILLKDHLVDKFKEERRYKKTVSSTFKSYANPIIKSCESLAWRLKEIFENRGGFLLDSQSKNEFFKYKYLSTIYRLCVVIGWIRAINREYAYIESPSKKGNKNIEKAILGFQSALADGQHMELSILKEVCKYWNIDLSKLSNDNQARLAIKIEEVVYSNIESRRTLMTSGLPLNEQITLLRKIAALVCETVNCSKLNDSIIEETKNQVIAEISRIEAWIYRDWQNAIGDIFLINIKGFIRRFDTIGYGDFEIMYGLIESDNQLWIKRIEKLIANLNVEIDDRFDSRVNQLKRLYKANLELLESFNKIIDDDKVISEDSLNKLKEFSKTINV